MSEAQFDTIIVGGGSAGCVLAHRLSEDQTARVLLLEAGRDTPPDRVPADILASYPRVAYFDPKNTWPALRVTLQPTRRNAPAPQEPRRYEQARIMGGGSSINDMQANRGTPDDYDEWHALGASGWGWQEVLPYFKRVERDMDFDGPLHGNEGRIPVRRIFPEVWPEFSKAAARAFDDEGYPNLLDQNGHFEDGYFPVAISNLYDRRVSSAIGYLDNRTRQRENLTIRADATVERILFEGKTTSGVALRTAAGRETIAARQVVVSAGAIHSPALLMRSGVGPGAQLSHLGIEVVADRPGVGENLQEHPTISLSTYMPAAARLAAGLGRHIHVGLRYSSQIADCGPQDMYMVALTKTGWHPVGRRIGSLLTWVNKPHSTGRVWLDSPDPAREPGVAFELLSDHRDAERLKQAICFMARLYRHPMLQAQSDHPFPTSYSERLRDLGKVSWKNRVLTGILAVLLDSSTGLRRLLIERLITEGAPLTEMLRDEELLDQFAREKAHGVWHASGTCRMGAPGDPKAVVDPAGRVIGVAGLRVVDASVMPRVPRANTNFPTMMIAEKMSDAIRAG